MSSKNQYDIFEKYNFIDDMIDNTEYSQAEVIINKELKAEISELEKLYLEVFKNRILRLIGNFKEARQNLEEKELEVLSTKNLFLNIFCFTELGWSSRLIGDLEQSSNYLSVAKAKINQLEPASEYLIRKLKEFNSNILHNKAVIMLERDNVTHALFTAYESLKFREQIGHKHGIADSLNNIGVMHWYNGELDLASEQFAKSYMLRREIGNSMLSALVLLNLVQLNVQRGIKYYELAKNYFHEFEEFIESDTTRNKLVENYFQFAKAVYLKSSNRYKHKAEAQVIFNNLIEKGELDSQHIMYAHYYLADLLFDELSTTGDQEILQELRSLVEKLEQLGDKKQMKVAVSRSHLLQSKLKIIDGNVEGAKSCMTIALNLALEANDNRLLHTITDEYDSLFHKEEDLAKINQETPFYERIEIAQIENLVSQLNQRGSSDIEDDEEKPILFMIMIDIGTLVYSKTFEKTSDLNENLVSNFIGAINNFGNEIFASSGFIERINHKDYTILMKSEGIFIFSYVFKGSSFAPSKKLNEITDKIMTLNFINAQDIERRIVTIKSSAKEDINSLVENVIQAA